ncbi:class II fructose-bisphosphate aldolase [Desulfoplanes formicivorans]|uniref:Ketose-bisphosphate aldolase n=1 Tax=Desulfoplanes formicivorans TaxID=1592317 RepID=A0A194ALL8_9BACT|nr:class II fructose-bisphosphate aldolase [Desulfoplanes formicivorans]GAU09554.1 ketose-bisphosphate aldolase [Desulfoplanes formicivorans]
MLRTISETAFEHALTIGRPPNIERLFPHSRALIVSGKVIDQALRAKGKAMTMAANGRNLFVIQGVLAAAERANAVVILEIAKSEGGEKAYCDTSFWNLARKVDYVCNAMKIRVPVAIHADHYAIKGDDDIERARTEIPSLFDAGVTSLAIDASHLSDEANLAANLELAPLIPSWAGYETEVGEIKGKEGLSTPEEALYLIKGLVDQDLYPDWIALNNGTTHGIETGSQGIQVDLTAQIHDVLAPYKISGAQHGTSGNNSERLKAIAATTRTTKANVATALQMISWGVKVNDYGNAQLDAAGNFIKDAHKGVPAEVWEEMVAYADQHGFKGGDFKKLNKPFENRLLGLARDVRERMAKGVEEFAYDLLTRVFNAQDSADLAIEMLMEAGTYDLGTKMAQE